MKTLFLVFTLFFAAFLPSNAQNGPTVVYEGLNLVVPVLNVHDTIHPLQRRPCVPVLLHEHVYIYKLRSPESVLWFAVLYESRGNGIFFSSFYYDLDWSIEQGSTMDTARPILETNYSYRVYYKRIGPNNTWVGITGSFPKDNASNNNCAPLWDKPVNTPSYIRSIDGDIFFKVSNVYGIQGDTADPQTSYGLPYYIWVKEVPDYIGNKTSPTDFLAELEKDFGDVVINEIKYYNILGQEVPKEQSRFQVKFNKNGDIIRDITPTMSFPNPITPSKKSW